MRSIPLKESDVGDELTADAFNSINDELKNIVESSEQTLDAVEGPDNSLHMLGQAFARYSHNSRIFQDSGSANAYILTASGNFKTFTKYFGGQIIFFMPLNSNTGASTININSIGSKNITNVDGSDLQPYQMKSGYLCVVAYNSTNDRFELINLSIIDTIPGQLIISDEDAVSEPNFVTCDGRLISRTTYSRLYELIGETFNVGDGSTTFGVPDIPDTAVIAWEETGAPTTYNSITCNYRDISINKTNRDTYIVAVNGYLGKKEGGFGNWIDQSYTPPTDGGSEYAVHIDSDTGDLYVFGTIYWDNGYGALDPLYRYYQYGYCQKLPYGTSTWVDMGMPTETQNVISSPEMWSLRDGVVDESTKNIYAGGTDQVRGVVYYDATLTTWDYIAYPTLPNSGTVSSIYSLCVDSANGLLYVGLIAIDPSIASYLYEVNLSTEVWTLMTNPDIGNSQIYGLAFDDVNGDLYAVAGGSGLNNVYKLPNATGTTWEEIPGPNHPGYFGLDIDIANEDIWISYTSFVYKKLKLFHSIKT